MALSGLLAGDYGEDGFRRCPTTGLRVHHSAERQVKRHALTAVTALLVGGVFALLVALTRWEAVGLLPPAEFYRYLSVHAWSLLIFWMVFMEVAILYVGGPFVLGRRLPFPRLATAAWVGMVGSALLILGAIWTTDQPNQQPLLTSYAPLPSSAWFYLGVVLFLLFTVVAAVPFLACIWQEKRAHPGRTLPLVTFGAFVTAIIALEALVGGLVTYVPTLAWRLGWLAHVDAAWYRQLYWTIGHGSQQINLVAMITVWYFLTHVAGGAEVVSEKVSRSAFVLYLFFINMGAAHHLMSDPAVSAAWRIWNTSYAAYGAAFASMVHAFAIPAGLEAGRRKKGKGGGLFGWLWTAPWRDPGFSATVLSVALFGFLGGITGVIMGQMQLNMTWHNTLAVPGHFHATVATGTTLAFMGLAYYVLRLVFRRERVGGTVAAVQPYLYGGAMGLAVLMLMYLGVLYGVPRRHPSVMDIPGTEFSFAASRPLFAVFGVAAVLAVLGGALFLAVALATLLVGEKVEPDPELLGAGTAADGGRRADGGEAADDGPEPGGAATVETDPGGTAGEDPGGATGEDPGGATGEDQGPADDDPVHRYSMRGTFVLVLVFLVAFVVTYALNWYLLSELWAVGG